MQFCLSVQWRALDIYFELAYVRGNWSCWMAKRKVSFPHFVRQSENVCSGRFRGVKAVIRTRRAGRLFITRRKLVSNDEAVSSMKDDK